MPTFKQLSDYYAKYIRNKLIENIFKMINYSTKSKDRRVELIFTLIAILKEINESLNQYNLSEGEKKVIINETAVYLGLERTNLLLMLQEASRDNFSGLTNCCENFFEEFKP